MEHPIFDLPQQPSDPKLILHAVPFDATTSYGVGTSDGPNAVLGASVQVDLFHPLNPKAWEKGFHLEPENPAIREWNQEAHSLVGKAREGDQAAQKKVNGISDKVNAWVYEKTKAALAAGKRVGTIGGDHSIPFGAIQAHVEKYPDMGILHFDAHFDLRKAYQGFEHSHASIMYNVLEKTHLTTMTAVAIRDFCEEEWNYSHNSSRHNVFTAEDIFRQRADGQSWRALSDKIMARLPRQVYVSFDIDAFEPHLCPKTGTPVPGGLEYLEGIYLLRQIIESGRELVGFDLCEVGPEEYDGNIGARVLYELCVLSLTNKAS